MNKYPIDFTRDGCDKNTTPIKAHNGDEEAMGCDIHAYVEYSTKGHYWSNLTDNAGGRDYGMFAIMAGVRDYNGTKLFDPKGMPEGETSFAVEGSYWLRIAPDAHPEWANEGGWCLKDDAARWVIQGSSEPELKDGKVERVTHPDWHSHSWLTSSELEQCVDKYRELYNGTAPTEWVAILAAMKAIEGNGDMARLVFWFDN